MRREKKTIMKVLNCMKVYVTVSNNNENKVEQMRECIESKLSGKRD